MTRKNIGPSLERLSSYYERHGIVKTMKRSGYEVLTLVDFPWAFLSWTLPGVTNSHEIRIVAQRRSGQHAIINWLRNQINGRYCFLNNCDVGDNPFIKCQRESSLFNNSVIERSWAFWEQEKRGRLSKKGVLIYNYEDKSILDVASEDFEAHRQDWLGESSRQTDILIMRDPFNLMASRFRWIYECGFMFNADDFTRILKTWKEHAHEFLGETNHLKQKLTISYNRWFCDLSYRKEIAENLGFRWNDDGMHEVAKWGPTVTGGSFDGLDYDGKAGQMKVLERWKKFADDPQYVRLFQDQEVFELSKRIFGEIEGTQLLMK